MMNVALKAAIVELGLCTVDSMKNCVREEVHAANQMHDQRFQQIEASQTTMKQNMDEFSEKLSQLEAKLQDAPMSAPVSPRALKASVEAAVKKTRSKKKAERAKAEEAKAEVKSVKGVPWPRSTDGAPGGEFCAQGTRPTRKRMRLNARRERVEARLEARRAARAAKDAVMIEAFFEQKRRDASSGSANNAVADPSPVVADESSSASAIADASSASAAVADASSSSYRVFDQFFQVWTDVGENGRGGDGGREEQAVADEPAVELGGDFDELAVEVLGSDNPYEVFADAPFTEAKESSKRMIMELEGLKVALKGLRTLKKKLLATEL